MEDSLYDDPQMDERLLPPEELQHELLQTNNINTLGDLVDAHGNQDDYDLDVTTRGLDPADLSEEDPLDTVIGFAGNFSNAAWVVLNRLPHTPNTENTEVNNARATG